jgi:hypothetical protein
MDGFSRSDFTTVTTGIHYARALPQRFVLLLLLLLRLLPMPMPRATAKAPARSWLGG